MLLIAYKEDGLCFARINKKIDVLEGINIDKDSKNCLKQLNKAKETFKDSPARPVGVTVFQGGIITYFDDGTYLMKIFAVKFPTKGTYEFQI